MNRGLQMKHSALAFNIFPFFCIEIPKVSVFAFAYADKTVIWRLTYTLYVSAYYVLSSNIKEQ